MKTINLILMPIFIGIILFYCPEILAQDYFRYHEGKKEVYQVATDRLVLKFKRGVSSQLKNQVIDNQLIDKSKTSLQNSNFEFIHLKKNADKTQLEALLKTYQQDDNILSASPMLINEKGDTIGAITDEFVVRLKPNTSIALLETMTSQYKVQIVEQLVGDKLGYVLATSRQTKENSLQLANIFHESGVFEYSITNFLLLGKLAYTPNDPSFTQQWGLNNTGQNRGTVDADMDVKEAWDITAGGSSAIRIAIIDVGVQLNHPDLQANLVAGFDATGNNTNGGPAIPADVHGTFVAGVAGMVGNNGIGGAGVAYNCKIVPIKSGTAILSIVDFSTTPSQMINSINWAAGSGQADILVMSFVMPPDAGITNAIQNATSTGRAGKGCIIFAASGNDNISTINYPASLDAVIAIGATDRNDFRASFSNFGTGLDVVAPSRANLFF
jgi:hypothetical protein